MSKITLTTLRARAIIAITFIFAAMGLGCMLIVGLVITERLDTFERELAAANMRRARNSLQQDMVRIDKLVKDWAWWDDTYQFMTTVSGDYVDSNITPDVFLNQGLSAIAFVTAHGEILHASYMPRGGEKLETPSEALLNHVRRTGLSYPAEDLFSGQPEIINVGGSLWMAASRAVLTSQQTGPARGRLWMIQEIDEDYIKNLAQRTELALEIHVTDAQELPGAMLALRTNLEELNEAVVVPERSVIWSGLLMPDAAGGTPIAIIASSPREVAALGRTTMKTTLAVVLIFGLVGFLSSIAFLEKRILSRLTALSAKVRRDAPHAQLCQIGQECDEIDQLSKLVDSAFKSIRENERFLQELAYADPLTGLPNRLCALERLDQTLQGLSRENGSLAVFLLDLDDFKIINDSWGHSMGDIVLMDVGRRICSALTSSEMVGRLGGDEFIIVSGVNGTMEEYAQLAQKLINTFTHPLQVGESETYLGVSVGISLFPEDGHSAGQLVRCADLAMYQSKSFGKNIYRFHSPELTLKAQRRVEIESELRQALDSREIVPYFQPVIDLETGRIIGAEALARWRKPDGRLVSPADFIPVAEQTSLIMDIDLSILSQACQQTRIWDENGLGNLRISGNISARHFQRGNLAQEVQNILQTSKLPARQLTLEITETVYMENIDMVRDTLDAIDRMGVARALDDFGTGYSSLSYVHTLSFDILKIDKSFVKNLPEHSALALVRAMLGIATSLDITPLAEGIETQEQLLLLTSLGCKLGQGYLFSPPVPAERFEELLKKQNTG
ncbi:MAG: EAL domain-containing protein [Desulfomicrobium sp.]|nr:EAL domain-containing protein [Desulfomicrobium sp.]